MFFYESGDKMKRSLLLLFLPFMFSVGFADLRLPLDRDMLIRTDVGKMSVGLVSRQDDDALPPIMRYVSAPLESDAKLSLQKNPLDVSFKLVLKNDTPYCYAFFKDTSSFGYTNLELDFKGTDNKIYNVRKRQMAWTRNVPEEVELHPKYQWENIVTLDSRLWEGLPVLTDGTVYLIRPRFAFGAYKVDSAYYRTIDEVAARSRKHYSLEDRTGEIVGVWARYRIAVNTNELPHVRFIPLQKKLD